MVQKRTFFGAEQSEDQSTLPFSRPRANERVKRAEKQEYPLITLLFLFIFISTLGWLFEVALFLIGEGTLINPGVLHGPWLPIYGFCGLGILLFLRRWRGQPAATFVLIMVMCGTLEFITGNTLELITGSSWWDYSAFTFNIGKYVCLEALLTFGILGVTLIYALGPFCAEKLEGVPLKSRKFLISIVLCFFLFDVAFSFVHPNYAASNQLHESSYAAQANETM